MGLKEILEFVRVEHTLFSLPFVLIGFVLADKEFGSEIMDLIWIMVAAVGARGLAMALNRIVDREIDADNPRTASRHLPSGTMSMRAAWSLAAVFLLALLLSAWQLNEVALKMAWLPVLAFVIYPYTKRVSWICHFWLGFCLALAPAGAWVAIVADTHGWASIVGTNGGEVDFLWFPEVFFISFGVALWIAAFDINYALMDVDVDREQGIRSFPASHGRLATKYLSIALTIGWLTRLRRVKALQSHTLDSNGYCIGGVEHLRDVQGVRVLYRFRRWDGALPEDPVLFLNGDGLVPARMPQLR